MNIRKWGRRLLAAFGVAAILVCPWPSSRSTQERAAAAAIDSLVSGSAVWHVPLSYPLRQNHYPLPDAQDFAHNSIYLANDTTLDLRRAIAQHRLKPFEHDDQQDLEERMDGWYREHRLIVITNEDTWESDGIEPALRINYFYGSLAAQAYRLRIYRCMLGTFVFYDHEWSS